MSEMSTTSAAASEAAPPPIVASDAENAYSARSIKVLRGLEAVRERPGMYIGDTDDGSGLHHMIKEVLDNAVDEALAGHASRILITLHADGSCSVEDDGRGVPVDIHPEEGVSAAEVIMTRLHAGGKFDQNSYKTSGGLHGVGVSVVNALSDWLELTVWRAGVEHFMRFREGAAEAPLEAVKKVRGKRGTRVRFMPAASVFTFIEFDAQTVEKRLQEVTYLNPGLEIAFKDERGEGFEKIIRHDGGLAEMVQDIDRNRQALCPEPIMVSGEHKDIQVEVALQWNDGYSETIRAYTNTIPQRDGGTHVTGLRGALTRAIANYLANNPAYAKLKVQPTGDDLREGFTAVISVKMPDPRFSSQTKEKLVSGEARTAVESLVAKALELWLDEHPNETREIIEKAVRANAAREAARKAREITRKKGSLDASISLPGKLADCQTKKPEEAELFIVEGDSAGGSAKQGRDRKFQAILPLRGKVLNVERASLEKMLANNEITALIAALGTGIGADDFDPEKSRYHRIIIMTDADVDGSHIRTLLLTFLFRQMRGLIEKGYVYIARPPLYRVKWGKQSRYIADDGEMARFLVENGSDGATLVKGKGKKAAAMAEEEFSALVTRSQRDKIVAERLGAVIGHSGLADALVTAGAIVAEKDGTLSFSIDKARAGIERLKAATGGSWRALGRDEAIAELGDALIDPDTRGVFVLAEDGVPVIYKVNDRIIEGAVGVERARLAAIATLWTDIVGLEADAALSPLTGPLGLVEAINERGRKGIAIQRYKGLGEMNADQLWETTLDPENRVLKQVSIDDLEETENLFVSLMGDEVSARREHLEGASIDDFNLDL